MKKIVLWVALCGITPCIQAQSTSQSSQHTSWQNARPAQNSSQGTPHLQNNSPNNSLGCSIEPPPEKDCTKTQPQHGATQSNTATRTNTAARTNSTTRTNATAQNRAASNQRTNQGANQKAKPKIRR